MIVGAIIMFWLSPAEYGLWQSVNLISVYGYVLLAGINPGLSRELPYALGAKKNDLAISLASNTKLISILAALLLFIGTLISSLFIDNFQLKSGIIVISLVTGIGFYRNYLLETCRATGALMTLLKIQGFEIILMIFSLIVVYKFQFQGMIYRALGIMIIVTILLNYLAPMKKVSPRWNRDTFLILLKTGFPLYMSSYLLLIGTTTDRLILVQFDTEKLGVYSPALMIFAAFQLIPNALSQYLSPKMSFMLGETKNIKDVWEISWKSSIILFLISLPLVGIAWFIIPFAINQFFPEYSDGIVAAQIACITGAVASSATGWMGMQSIKAFKAMFIIGFFIMIIGYGFSWALSSLMDPLLGVSLGKLATYILFIISSLLTVRFIANKKYLP
jgi:O-antigen/teichoic acid export membrane protein